ncbi:hypothetical protein GCM10009750_15680 [Agromyces salentinus]|uniref:Uncharacterized protein n=1 Tax=Agromyces salentinus TaxID=269421 RepID=A0ABP4YZ00_9MICO
MTTGREVGRVAEDAVGSPDDHMRDAWRHVLPASWADVGLDGLGFGHGLDVPLASAPGLGSAPAGTQAFDVEFGVRLTRLGRATMGSVRARHASKSRTGDGIARHRRCPGAVGQYQPTDSEWAQAPQGVPYRPCT